MPLNRAQLIRLATLDRCLCNRYRRWTLQDLIDACSDALGEMEGRYTPVSRRTIQGDIQLMRSDRLGYNAPIKVVDNKYYIYDDPDYSIANVPLSREDITTLNSAMDILRHFQIFPQLSSAADVISRLEEHIAVEVSHQAPAIHLEGNARLRGLHLLPDLYGAVRRRQALLVTYKSFKARAESVVTLSPYLLKEYRNRWFLLGSRRGHLDGVQIMAVDPMIRVEDDTEHAFEPNEQFDPEHFFDNVVGVTKTLGQPSETVVLWISAGEAPYALTKPLHTSQQVRERRPDGSVVVTLQVVVNLELERLILGHGDRIEVLAPRLLRHRVARAHQRAALIYARSNEEKT